MIHEIARASEHEIARASERACWRRTIKFHPRKRRICPCAAPLGCFRRDVVQATATSARLTPLRIVLWLSHYSA